MTTETEYGPPIAVNGKRPEWLGDDIVCIARDEFIDWTSSARCAAHWVWDTIQQVRLPADHPYYQSAEYKAASGFVGEDDRGYVYQGAPITDSAKAVNAAVATLEAAGYTVTPPDPLAADREFLAGLEEATDCTVTNKERWRSGDMDEHVVKVMEYLRANKGRL